VSPLVSDAADVDVAALSAAYPAWHIWRSQAGRWWATRPGESDTDLAQTIDADSLSDLAKELAYQMP
jgi:hypothetical protein